ncbi:MAG TPA: ATP-binding cassette domain-containing protein [Candidatus Methylacidiphilales bacterium]|nr:ATP-binding cassette domain-containing protein [Candidatus Methylacidiphilales bacterium]
MTGTLIKSRSKPVFEVTKLRVEREAVILREINWRVERGQHWAILGANGSGKTSLLSALTGYLMPSRGEIRIGAAKFGAADWREVRRTVGLVSSSLGQRIEPDQTARDVILSGREGQINFWRRADAGEERRTARVLRRINAAHLAERPWLFLSQGERQRVLIGRALMARLRLLFLDEPCAGLDPVAREDFLKFLGKLARKRHAPALVLVTHHIEEIVPLFTHVLLLSRGRTLAAGPKAEVLTSARLSATFGAPVIVWHAGGRYRLGVRRHALSFTR